MNKQEFLAMSLPYKLMMYIKSSYPLVGEIQIREYNYLMYGNDYEHKPISIKPIIHPLSDLTKEIEHKGEKFVPYKKLDWELQHNYCGMGEVLDFGDCHSGTVNVLDYIDTLQKLIEWHFDIADLISKGEAIDVNTLEANPYN